MATRASSRRITSQNGVSSPVQATRTMRSRSRDTNDVDMSAARIESKAPVARRGPGRPPKARQDLATVAEGSSVSSALLRVKKTRKSSGTASALSGTTARTSLTDEDPTDLDSDVMITCLQELSQWSDNMIDTLAPQGGMSVESIKMLATGLANPDLRTTKNFVRYQAKLAELRGNYGNGTVINISVALRGIIGATQADVLTTGLWRPDDIFHKANLAATLEEIYLQLKDDPDMLSMEKLDRNFPEPFLARLTKTDTIHSSPGTSALFKETLDIGLDVRTHYALQVIREQAGAPNFVADDILSQIFFAVDDNSTMRAWDVDGLRLGDLKNSQRSAYAQRVDQITEALGVGSGEEVDFYGLNNRFPILAFVQRFAAWTRSRLDEINRHIDMAGKPAGIQQSIESEIRRREAIANVEDAANEDTIRVAHSQSPDIAAAAAVTETMQEQTPARALPLEALKQLRRGTARAHSQKPMHYAVENQLLASSDLPRDSQNQAPLAPMFGQTNPQYLQADSTPIDPALDPALYSDQRPLDRNQLQTTAAQVAAQFSPAQVAQATEAAQKAVHSLQGQNPLRAIVERQHQIEEETSRENNSHAMSHQYAPHPQSIFDRQPGAVREEWNSQAPVQIGTVGPSLTTTTGAQDEDEDVFEQDQRSPVPTSVQPARRKRGRLSGGGVGGDSRAKRSRPQSVMSDPSQNVPTPYHTGTNRDPRVESLPAATQAVYDANQMAKQATANKNKSKQPQRRRQWTPEETDSLRKLIEEVGTSWAKIKKRDDNGAKVLKDRDQVALKDKARNMKFDMLKAGADLPENFRLVPLKQTQKDELVKYGVDSDEKDRKAAEAMNPNL